MYIHILYCCIIILWFTQQVERLNLENLESPVVKVQLQAVKENMVAKKTNVQKKSGDDPKPTLPKKVMPEDLSKKNLPKNTNEKILQKLKAENVITATVNRTFKY